ncbi:hypothetical protein B0H16DRAFT_202293 [Mycena metata]|uniref:Uncharacterized protein n=1 Tax=Mycena metata TaxID=1033252 RepID=A0AAD7HZA7_9AGAR|nr:hypothetical protein B0H16DRAFT_202293 [Mycena metata]
MCYSPLSVLAFTQLHQNSLALLPCCLALHPMCSPGGERIVGRSVHQLPSLSLILYWSLPLPQLRSRFSHVSIKNPIMVSIVRAVFSFPTTGVGTSTSITGTAGFPVPAPQSASSSSSSSSSPSEACGACSGQRCG